MTLLQINPSKTKFVLISIFILLTINIIFSENIRETWIDYVSYVDHDINF